MIPCKRLRKQLLKWHINEGCKKNLQVGNRSNMKMETIKRFRSLFKNKYENEGHEKYLETLKEGT